MNTRPMASSVGVSARMSRQARRDTQPELRLRRELHRRGLRFRVDYPLPGMPRRRADVVFTRAKIAVFVDGCFWHGCPEHRTYPASNDVWWLAKLTRNIERDRETDQHLSNAGWTVLRFWEHEDPISATESIMVAMTDKRGLTPSKVGQEWVTDGSRTTTLGDHPAAT